MANSKWTSGTWMAAAKPSSVVGWPIVSSPMGQAIANVHMNDEAMANAHLIAAAPDLYKALAVMEQHHQTSPHIGLVRAALAKARGEQS